MKIYARLLALVIGASSCAFLNAGCSTPHPSPFDGAFAGTDFHMTHDGDLLVQNGATNTLTEGAWATYAVWEDSMGE